MQVAMIFSISKLKFRLILIGIFLLVLLFTVLQQATSEKEFQPILGQNNSTVSMTSTMPLQELGKPFGLTIGTAVQANALREDDQYREILAQEFNSLTPENAMKFGVLSSEKGHYNFANADKIVAFAQTHQMEVHGHVLVWYRNLPDWLEDQDWTREELMQILRQHIYTVAGRYRGQIASWDVVNEAVDRKGKLRDSLWLDTIGADYLEMAFWWAHEADPDARLFYNDYNGEELGRKSDAIYELVKDLRQRNVPIHGVGLQMHIGIDQPPNLGEIAANIQRLGDLGLEVKITEMDVKIQDSNLPMAERLAKQAEIYQGIAQVCLQAPNCNSLTTWGLADHWSWIPIFTERPDAPLLFDESYRPKPAYSALARLLKQARD